MGAREGEERKRRRGRRGRRRGVAGAPIATHLFSLSFFFCLARSLSSSLAFARVLLRRAAPRSLSLFLCRWRRIEGERRELLFFEKGFFWRFCLVFFFPFEEMKEQSAQIGSGNSSRRQQREKDETEKAMPASLLRSASASAAVAAAPPACRGARLPRTAHAAPSRTPVGVVAAGGRLPRRRQWNDASSSTAATKAVPTANTFAAPATAEQRPIPGEDLFMVREGRHSISP